MIETSSAFIAGMVVGGMFFAMCIISGDVKVITHNFTCTKTEIVGISPNREETCVLYERKE